MPYVYDKITYCYLYIRPMIGLQIDLTLVKQKYKITHIEIKNNINLKMLDICNKNERTEPGLSVTY